MGEAKRRGTFEERKAAAVIRDKHVKEEADKLFAKWKAKQEPKSVTPQGDTLVVG